MTTSTDDIAVLHVEDDRDLAEMAATFLERENERFTIETADHAEDGLQRLDQKEYDCIVSDYDMPGQNGIEFLKTVRAENESIPFILFTGKGSEEVAAEAIAADATDYLQKGAGSEVYSLLTNRIRNAVEQYHSKQAQQEIQERYQTLVENSPNPIAVHRSGIVFANEAMTELLGANDIAEIHGIQPKDIIHPEYHSVFEDQFKRVKKGETIRRQEIFMNRLDGETRQVEVSANTVKYGGNSAIQIVIQDITERVERERELQWMKSAIDAADHAIYITNVDGVIQHVNPAFEDLTGYGREEAIGNTPHILNSGRMPDAYFEDLWETILAGRSWEETIVNRTKDDELFQARQTISSIKDDQGEIEAFVAIQKEIEEDTAENELAT